MPWFVRVYKVESLYFEIIFLKYELIAKLNAKFVGRNCT